MDEGFILDKKIGVGQPKRIENAKILVANTAMDTDKIKIYGARVRVDSMQKVSFPGRLKNVRIVHVQPSQGVGAASLLHALCLSGLTHISFAMLQSQCGSLMSCSFNAHLVAFVNACLQMMNPSCEGQNSDQPGVAGRCQILI